MMRDRPTRWPTRGPICQNLSRLPSRLRLRTRSRLGLLVLLFTLSQPLGMGARAELSTGTQDEPSDDKNDGGLFRSANDEVDEGNARMAAGDAAGALAAYDQAAKALPNAAGVHLNRGLALLSTDKGKQSREAFKLATQPPATKSVRAAAYYNLGNAFYKDGDALAAQEQHDTAQARFREAVDAFKQSLRLRPGNEDAAWNLQLASRRLQEEQEKQEQQEQEQEQEQQQDDQQDGDQQSGDQQSGDQQQEQNDSQQDGDQQQEQDDSQQGDQQDGDQQQEAPEQDGEQDGDQQPEQQPQAPEQDAADESAPPSEVERALDALQDGEENLQRYRARQQAGQQRRTPEKDW